jgi:hypothetical protein
MAGGDDTVDRLGALCADARTRRWLSVVRDGTCAGYPCRYGYVDRTRARRQRFCCDLCNDRTAAVPCRSRHAYAESLRIGQVADVSHRRLENPGSR